MEGSAPAARKGRWVWWALGVLLLTTGVVIVGASRWLVSSPSSREENASTRPTLPRRHELPQISGLKGQPAEAVGNAVEERKGVLPDWPIERTTGEKARQVSLAYLRRARDRIHAVPSYTATFRRQERIKGKLMPEQTLDMKVMHNPFSIYLRFVSPRKGKEALYVEGVRGSKVMAHNGDWTRKLIPLLEVDPDSPVALMDNRHPITEAGLENLIDRLVYYRELDVREGKGTISCDRVRDEQGKEWFRYMTEMPEPDGIRPFARVIVLICPELQMPLRIRNYEWPKGTQTGGEPVLVESYSYDDLKLDIRLSEADFDPRNPEYAFYTE